MMGMMGQAMGGQCSDGGMYSLAETHSEKSEPAVTEKLETPAEVVDPVLEATSPIVHSTPKESSPGVLIALASGSFFVGLVFTFIILRVRQKQPAVEELDFNYTLEADTESRRI